MARRVFPEDSPSLNSENIKESFDKIERWLRYMQERIEHMNYSQGVIDLRQSEELGLVVKRAGNTITINDDNIVTQSQRTSDNQTYTSSISQNAEKIALVVKTENNQNIIKAAEIVTAINATGSTVKISADHITLDGDVVMKSNLYDGTTRIDGGNILTGIISDTNGNYSLNLSTGTVNMKSANITGGTVNIDTSVSTDDLIKLNYIVQNGASTYVHTHTEQSPTHFVVEQTPLDDSEHTTTVDSNGISNDYAEYYSLLTCANLVFKYAEPGGGSLTHVTRAVTSKDGVFFYDSSGTQTASYPAAGLAVSGLQGCSSADLSSSGSRTYTLAAGSYLVTLTRTSGTSANYDGAWLVTAATNSRVTALKAPSNSETSISMGTNRVMTVTTSQTNMRLTVTKLN